MRYKWIYGLLVLCVSALILMSNALAATGPLVWVNQATLSTIDAFQSQDPENSGFGPLQVSVWEEGVAPNRDIYMKYSFADGALGSWFFPVVHPAITTQDEINPAVAVTRNHPVYGQEIHVVYQRWNSLGFWEICHTYTNNLGAAWNPVIVLSTPNVDSTNPACVYTEDQTNFGPGQVVGFLIQVVWEEAFAGGGTQIMYDAYAYDPGWVPPRGTIPGCPFPIRTPPAGGTSELPEIASVDERQNPNYDYTFNIVWQEFDPVVGNWNVWYSAGRTTTSAVAPPPPPPFVAIVIAPIMLNPANAAFDHTDPDIAASQDYAAIGAPLQQYYFHVDWVRQTIAGPPFTFSLESGYSLSPNNPTPAPPFTNPGSVYSVVTPVAPPVLLIDNPTIATKLTTLPPVPIIFEIWFAWEDFTAPTKDIWYRMGTFTVPAAFAYLVPAARVPYVPNPGNEMEQNPELWNREDALRLNPPVTHLVFDLDPHPLGVTVEVEYIDP
jgi:hypothetical protein